MTAATLTYGSATRLRITRRGRAVLAGAILVPLLSAAIAFGINASPAAAGDAQSVGGSLNYVTVLEGESLWSVAESVAPGRDPRDVIADIVRLNGLDSANVPAGVSIAVPQY
ncbi:MAG: LysM peptidoglycan-binding domain-containing protein [Agromyces sp.]